MICFNQTFLVLGVCKLFPARENLISDIPAGDGNTATPFFYSVLWFGMGFGLVRAVGKRTALRNT